MAQSKLNIAVLSGKGGTGKTLISVNLASVAKNSTYVDCDVEEPNGHLFFKPINIKEKEITVKIPTVDETRCTGCRKCVDFCKFNALAIINKKLMVFENICHSCGGCVLLCPEKALTETDKSIGHTEIGTSGDVTVISGILNTGEASGVPIINDVLHQGEQQNKDITFIDCPPGSACVVMESIKEADYCVLVAEPTVFGVHNLSMVYELVRLFNKPYGVILNKCLKENNPAETFCLDNNVNILGKIPFDHELGKINSNALILARENNKYHDLFKKLLYNVLSEVQSETIVNP